MGTNGSQTYGKSKKMVKLIMTILKKQQELENEIKDFVKYVLSKPERIKKIKNKRAVWGH